MIFGGYDIGFSGGLRGVRDVRGRDNERGEEGGGEEKGKDREHPHASRAESRKQKNKTFEVFKELVDSPYFFFGRHVAVKYYLFSSLVKC